MKEDDITSTDITTTSTFVIMTLLSGCTFIGGFDGENV